MVLKVKPDRFAGEEVEFHAASIAMLPHLVVEFLIDGDDPIVAFLRFVHVVVLSIQSKLLL